MEPTFFERNLAIGFFAYGLAFFSMGLAVWLESGRTSEFRSNRIMRFLAGFGILHGLHEWLEMFTQLDIADMINLTPLVWLHGVRVFLLAASFLFLILFGVRMIAFREDLEDNGRFQTIIWVGALTIAWLGTLLAVYWIKLPTPLEYILAIDALSRYMLGIPGAVLASRAMLLQQQIFKARGMTRCGRDMRWAAVTLLLYGVVGQAFPNASLIFPSHIVNSDSFQQIFGFPVQLFRTAAAIVIAFFVIRALRAFELQRQQQLATANEDRLAAQQEALTTQQRSRIKTEKLNQDLQLIVQDLSMLFELSSSLAKTLDRDALLQQAMTQIFNSVPRIGGGMILLADEPKRPLQIMACVGYKEGVETETTRKVGEYTVRTGQSAWWNGITILPLPKSTLSDEVITATISTSSNKDRSVAVPIMVQDQVIGALVLSITLHDVPFTVHDLSLIKTVASQLSMAIENATLYQKVQMREALRGELLRQVVSAQEAERQRIARELHDGPGQILSALGLGLAAAGESARNNPELSATQLIQLKSMSSDVMQEIHDLIADLRPSLLDNLGLVPALRSLVQEFGIRHEMETQFLLHGQQRRVQSEIETIVFRVIQEALANVAKHAAAQNVKVRLAFDENKLTFFIQDDGCGFDLGQMLNHPLEGRWGLVGIQERVTLVDGDCKIVSEPGSGTIVQICIYLNKEFSNGKS
ncbi:MAG: GAF domain-containing sensor histidine kinase [Chloroflexi bacterium]|nr:GAF domain-containing sensor histidine kinase [Chloroflexota bacterium]